MWPRNAAQPRPDGDASDRVVRERQRRVLLLTHCKGDVERANRALLDHRRVCFVKWLVEQKRIEG